MSIDASRTRARAGILVHRRRRLAPFEVTEHRGIPVTTPTRTLIDLGARLDREPLEPAVNAAVGLSLTSPPKLRRVLTNYAGHPGVKPLRDLLDAATFRLTDSHLERLIIPIALEAGLPRPLTQQKVNGYRVDFFWPDLGLVVETDGGNFHKTAAQQTADRRRDQAHTVAGLIALRFTPDQIAHDRPHVLRTLSAVSALARPTARSRPDP